MGIEELETEFSKQSINLFNKMNENLARVKELLINKNKEYAKTDDVFENFELATEIINMVIGNVKWEQSIQSSMYNMALKHFVSILTVIRNYEDTGIKPSDSLRKEKFGDAQCYLHLIDAKFSE